MKLTALAAVLCFAAAAPAAELKIALLCSGSVNDGGWNQLAKDGIERLKESHHATTTVVQKVSADQAATELRDFAADGYQLVIAHGYEFLNPAAQTAAAVPATRIAVSGADVEKPGIVTIDFDVSQASYQLGVLAGRLTKSGKLGFIGGGAYPSVKACYRGFIAGAKSVRADVTVAEAYTSWDDVAKNKSQAEAFISQGIDQIYPDVDAAARGVFEAVKEHNVAKPDALVWNYGCVGDSNANPASGAWTVASAVIRLDNAFAHVASQVRDNAWKPGVVRENLASGTCIAVLNPALDPAVLTPALRAEVEAAGKALVDGKIAIP
jgi:basic membrane protein A